MGDSEFKRIGIVDSRMTSGMVAHGLTGMAGSIFRIFRQAKMVMTNQGQLRS